MIVDAVTGAEADPVLVDRASGRPLVEPAFRSAPGPAATERTRQRIRGERSSRRGNPAGARQAHAQKREKAS